MTRSRHGLAGNGIVDPVCSLLCLAVMMNVVVVIGTCGLVYGPTFTRSKKIPAPQPLHLPWDAMS